MNLAERLNITIRQHLNEDDEVLSDLNEMLRISESIERYNSVSEFAATLEEGRLLQVNRLMSNAIGLPTGEYLIWQLDEQKAMLYPTEAITKAPEVMANYKPMEVERASLLGCWNKAERSLVENDQPRKEYSRKRQVQRSKSKYPRNPQAKGAIEASGKSQEDIANACGVDPSTVSRITAQSGEGARKPSVDVAMCVANQTGQDVETMFNPIADIPEKQSATSGSGGGRNATYRQGSK